MTKDNNLRKTTKLLSLRLKNDTIQKIETLAQEKGWSRNKAIESILSGSLKVAEDGK